MASSRDGIPAPEGIADVVLAMNTSDPLSYSLLRGLTNHLLLATLRYLVRVEQHLEEVALNGAPKYVLTSIARTEAEVLMRLGDTP